MHAIAKYRSDVQKERNHFLFQTNRISSTKHKEHYQQSMLNFTTMAFSNSDHDFYRGGGGGIRLSSGYDENNNRRTRRITSSSSATGINTTTTIGRNKSHGNDGDSMKIQNAPLIVTHYFQWWQLTGHLVEIPLRYIRTLTTITLSVTDGAEYGSFFKSIALADATIDNILVSQLLNDFDEDTYGLGQSSSKTTLYHDLSVRNGYHFVEFEFDKPLVSGHDTTIEIVYDMSEGDIIDSCQAEHTCPTPHIESKHYTGPSPHSESEDGSLECINCKEEFSAPWANQWKIPVHDVTYRFTVDSQYDQITPKILVSSDKEKQWKDSSCSIPTDESNNADFICSELDEASSKVIPAFRWYLNDSFGTMYHCSSKCDGGAPAYNIILSAALGGTIALFCISLGLCHFSGAAQRRRREQTRQDSRTTVVAVATLDKSQSSSFSYMDAKVRQLPLLPFGANDSQVADAVQAYELESSAQQGSFDVDNADISPTCFRQQQIAFSACESCSICITDFTMGEMVCLLPRCGHTFHSECVRKWLVDQESAYCPLCQARVLILE